MKLSIPITVEDRRHERVVRPLFRPDIVERSAEHGQAIERLVRRLRGELDQLAQNADHRELAAWAFDPDFHGQVLSLRVELRQRIHQLRVLVVTMKRFGRIVAYTPSLDAGWFEVDEGEVLAERTAEVIAEHLTLEDRRRAQNGDEAVVPEDLSMSGRVSWTRIDVDVLAKQRLPKTFEQQLAALGAVGTQVSGFRELATVGRRLDDLYPDGLERAVGRDQEVDALERLLDDRERPAILLVGPRQVGKTAVLHECLHRRLAEQRRQRLFEKPVPRVAKGPRVRRTHWQLNPQRLISGMSFVGQWEQRLLAILSHAEKRDLVLYFDDLIGLFRAGVSADSSVSVGHVLGAQLDRRRICIVGEATPEQLRVLKELDRGFVERFRVVRVEPFGRQDTLAALLSVVRGLELRRGVRIDPGVVLEVADRASQLGRGVAQPGATVSLLRELVEQCADRDEIDTADLDRVIQTRTGLPPRFARSEERVLRKDIVTSLTESVVGQPRAVEAMTDALLLMRAGIQDPRRPLGSFLFLGPTGVGKTQAAKALARHLFGDAGRMVRFDMNEYGTPWAAARLVGTFDQPEGLLTSRIGRQPFAVLLLDEIEKADPAVFDLLLQVLGEGRLTGALGRTVDFSKTFVVLTSNLGAREAGERLGFDEAVQPAAYEKAARRFFRPELFNRIDRIVPFGRLDGETLRTVAQHVLDELFVREGLTRRRVALQIEPAAFERILEIGDHPELGARALSRAIERSVTMPLARHLAADPAEATVVATIYSHGESIRVGAHTLEAAARLPWTERETTPEVVPALRSAIEAMVRRVLVEHAGADDGKAPVAFDLETLDPALRARLEIRNRADELLAAFADLDEAAEQPVRRTMQRGRGMWKRMHGEVSPTRLMKSLFAAQAIDEFWHDVAGASDEIDDEAVAVVDRARRNAAALHHGTVRPRTDYCVVMVDAVGNAGAQAAWMLDRYRALAGEGAEAAMPDAGSSRLEVQSVGVNGVERGLRVDGPGAWQLLEAETGTHLFIDAQRRLSVVRVQVTDLRSFRTVDLVLRRDELHWVWKEMWLSGSSDYGDDPERPGPIVRIYDEANQTLDLHSGMLVSGLPTGDQFEQFLYAALPEPPEIEAVW